MTTRVGAPDSSAPGRLDSGYLVDRWLRDPLGLIILIVAFIPLAYGGVHNVNSPFMLPFFEAMVGGVFSGIEVLILLLPILGLIRRIVLKDWSFVSSPLDVPMVILLTFVFLIPLLRMWVVEGGVRAPFEIFFLPVFALLFFVYRLVFRPADLRLMIWIIVAAAIYKIAEGFAIYLTRGVMWGIMTGWRDGLLMSMIVLGVMLAYAIPDDGSDPFYRKFRKVLFWLAPLATFIFIGSMRRSFLLALILILPAIYFKIDRVRRKRVVGMLAVVVGLMTVSLGIIGFELLTGRLEGLQNPGEEGSAAWRMVEAYNVVHMIAERPIFGWPLGVEFKNYTGIALPQISTLIPHNIYLYALLRGGILGLAALLWFLVRLVRMQKQHIRVARSPREHFLSIWLYASTLLVILAGLTSPIVASKLAMFLPFLFVLSIFHRVEGDDLTLIGQNARL